MTFVTGEEFYSAHAHAQPRLLHAISSKCHPGRPSWPTTRAISRSWMKTRWPVLAMTEIVAGRQGLFAWCSMSASLGKLILQRLLSACGYIPVVAARYKK